MIISNQTEAENNNIPEADIFNKEALMERVMGDEEIAKTILQAFLEDIPKQIQTLAEAIKNNDTDTSERQAHSIKGASANIGAEELRKIAFVMEIASRDTDFDIMKTHLEELEREYKLLKEAIEMSL